MPDNATSCPFGTYILNLENHTEDELFNNLHPKRRNSVRVAEKNELTVKWTNTVDDFYTLYEDTMKRAGMFCEPYEYFKQMIALLGEQQVLCGVSYFKNRPQAALCVPFSRYSAYYMHGATSDNHEAGAMDFLQWEAIKILKAKGVKQYNFVGARLSDISGTKLDGIQNFKKRFGGELERGYLWKMDLNKFQCFLYDSLLSFKLILKGKRRMKDIIDEETERLK